MSRNVVVRWKGDGLGHPASLLRGGQVAIAYLIHFVAIGTKVDIYVNDEEQRFDKICAGWG
jgi:hypothetical protein